MKIAVVQKDRNELLYLSTLAAVRRNGRDDEVLDFGRHGPEDAYLSYVEAAVDVSLLLCTGAADFAVTGCSSGQGMMLACNSLPGVLCGFVQTPQDAFLFGRINGGNAVSLPLALNFGWQGEINLQCTLDKLFEGEFGCGWPPSEADRKRRDAAQVKALNALTKRDPAEVFARMDPALLRRALSRACVRDYLLEYGTDPALDALIRDLCH